MISIDSNGWIDYFLDEDKYEVFAQLIEGTDAVLVPVPCLYEVYRDIRHQMNSRRAAEVAIQSMTHHIVVPLEHQTTQFAAQFEGNRKLSACDRFIYAISRQHGATLWTKDSGFVGLPDVRYVG